MTDIGESGGSSTADLPERTGNCSNQGSNPGNKAYKTRDDNQGWGSDVHLRVDGGSSRKEGQHRHNLGGTVRTIPPFVRLLKIMRVV